MYKNTNKLLNEPLAFGITLKIREGMKNYVWWDLILGLNTKCRWYGGGWVLNLWKNALRNKIDPLQQ